MNEPTIAAVAACYRGYGIAMAFLACTETEYCLEAQLRPSKNMMTKSFMEPFAKVRFANLKQIDCIGTSLNSTLRCHSKCQFG
jgi:hypothetical protein